MDSSVAQLGNIAVRTFDKTVQEDARRLRFSGPAKVSLTSAFPADLRAHQEAGSALVIQLKRSGKVPDSVLLSMDCADSCNGSVNIAPQLQAMADEQWQTLSIDLTCFAKQGTDLAQVFSPIAISTDAALQLSLADIRLVPHQASTASLSCQ